MRMRVRPPSKCLTHISANGTPRKFTSSRRSVSAIGQLESYSSHPPGTSSSMSRAYVSAFMATMRSKSGVRATCPSPLTRISYQVGRPWMFDGKTFFPDTGIPMRKIDCMMRPLALAEPVPLTVPILNAKSLLRTSL